MAASAPLNRLAFTSCHFVDYSSLVFGYHLVLFLGDKDTVWLQTMDTTWIWQFCKPLNHGLSVNCCGGRRGNDSWNRCSPLTGLLEGFFRYTSKLCNDNNIGEERQNGQFIRSSSHSFRNPVVLIRWRNLVVSVLILLILSSFMWALISFRLWLRSGKTILLLHPIPCLHPLMLLSVYQYLTNNKLKFIFCTQTEKGDRWRSRAAFWVLPDLTSPQT